MRRLIAPMALVVSLLSACGGDSGGEDAPGGASNSDVATGGQVVSPQPPGQGFASVDGLEYSFDTPALLPCAVSDDEFGFSFVIGDNEVNFGGGASITGGQWFGSVTLQVFADDGVTTYSAKIVDNPSAIATDANSVSYAGPMERTDPSTDGALPEPVDVGNGTFSVTCG